eukprot:Phypoly_transcript_03995.p1 GENE.Phypoly_transcript_03995~~Phypoly_transcript_03995.p1  ORF type:complete len:350 (+),score=28.52 Phypoly_transcript_03995:94-1050(+)
MANIPPLGRSQNSFRDLRSEEEGYPLLKSLPNANHKDREGEEREKPPNIFQRCYRSYFADTGESYVDALLAANAFVRAARFFPALFITFCIELGNSLVLGEHQELLQSHFTLVLFIPVISAIAGNIGLQTSSSVTSFLNLRIIDKKPYSAWGLMWKYVAHCALQMIILSSLMGGLADIWRGDDVCRHSHGIIVFVGATVNMLIASMAGVAAPVVLNLFGYDPSSGAGPFETALQDVVGAVFFVYFAKWVLTLGINGCKLNDNKKGDLYSTSPRVQFRGSILSDARYRVSKSPSAVLLKTSCHTYICASKSSSNVYLVL